ncbi:MAG: exo-alpha-sialidase, partial [Deltaproteobacteria bacterium]
MRKFIISTLWVLLLPAVFGLNSCSERSAVPDLAPSDDPADYDVDTSIEYQVQVSEPRWVVPSEALPAEAPTMASNANVDIIFHTDRLFMAWRTAPEHFASDQVYMLVVSSLDGGKTWEFEHLIDLDTDLREPRFLSYGGKLQLIFFQAGTIALSFEPITMWRTVRRAPGDWSEIEVLVDGPEVPWDVKVRGGIAYMTSYRGEHYSGDEDATVRVFFKYSTDGDTWKLVDDRPSVYEGGVSESAFEFDEDGSLWVVTRNEDGDET